MDMEEMLCFRTQSELLEYLGKRNDRNLIKRMVKRGEVVREEGVYYLKVEKEKKSETGSIYQDDWEEKYYKLHGDYIRLEQELEKWRGGGEGESGMAGGGDVSQYKEWLDQANKAYEDLEAERKAEVEDITRRCWDYMFQRKCCPTQTKQQFSYWILGKSYGDVQFSPDDIPF